MHPADVAEFVAAAVDELRRRLAANPDLRAGPPTLEADIRLYVPFEYEERRLVDAAIPSGIVDSSGRQTAQGWIVPDLGAPPATRRLLLHLDLTDFDGQAPTAELLRQDRYCLPADEWPLSLGPQAVVAQHPDYARPFFCRRGLREFHSHPQHEDEPWDKHREGLPLYLIVLELITLLQDRHSWRR